MGTACECLRMSGSLHDIPRAARPDGSTPGASAGSEGRASGAGRSAWLLAIVLVACGALVAHQILMRSVVAAFSENSPAQALALSADDPASLLEIVEGALRSRARPSDTLPSRSQSDQFATNVASDDSHRSQREVLRAKRLKTIGMAADLSSTDVERYKQIVEAALAREPFSGRGLRLLGILEFVEGNTVRATKLLKLAVQLDKRQIGASLVLLELAFEAGDWPEFLYYADIAMKARTELVAPLAPAIVRVLERADGKDLVTDMLIANPSWRAPFLNSMLRGTTNAYTPLRLFLALGWAGRPPDQLTVRIYLDFLVAAGLLEQAYNAWLQLLSPDELAAAGNVFDGEFDLPQRGTPFDWAIGRSAGAMVDVAASSN